MKRAIATALLLSLPAGAQDGGRLTLFTDYGCQEAPAPVAVDGGWLLTDARAGRVNCALAGAQAELDVYRDAGTVPASSVTWIASAAVCVAAALFQVYADNRTARGLPLWPP